MDGARTGVGRRLRGVVFINESLGWAVGDLGTIIATTDGGSTWVTQTSGVDKPLTAVSFVDVNHGWAVGLEGTILRTTTGGVSR